MNYFKPTELAMNLQMSLAFLLPLNSDFTLESSAPQANDD